MKAAIYIIVTCLISTFAFLGALGPKNSFPYFVIAFGVWALFFWRYTVRLKKAAEKRSRERLFEDYMRSRLRTPSRY